MLNGSPCAKCLNVLGVPSRMRIYNFLKEKGSHPVSDIVAIAQLRQPTVSYHLKEMKTAGLLYSKKRGKEVIYGVTGKCISGNKECVLNKVNFPHEDA